MEEELGRLGQEADRATRASTEPASGLGPDGRVSTDAGHTPGPWLDVGDGYIEARNAPLKARSGWYDYAYLQASPEERAEWQANARLIAAAPELLEALRWFVDDERFQVAVGGNPNVVERMIANAQAVYAKATGAA
jgi:hypothetical protein